MLIILNYQFINLSTILLYYSTTYKRINYFTICCLFFTRFIKIHSPSRLGSRCTIPVCPKIIINSNNYQNHIRAKHFFHASYKCKLCKLVIFYSSLLDSIKNHLVSCHGKDKNDSNLDQFMDSVSTSNFYTFFGDKKTNLISLKYPISKFLHRLMKNINLYDQEIELVNKKFFKKFKDYRAIVKIPNHEELSIKSECVVYLKFEKGFLKRLQDEQKNLTLSRLIISLLNGDIGETSNFDVRETAHRSSRHLCITLPIVFFGIPPISRKVFERLFFKLLDIDNFANTKMEAGTNYVFENLTPCEHVYLLLGLLKRVFEEMNNFYTTTDIKLFYDELILNSQDIVLSQSSSVSLDPEYQITAISAVHGNNSNLNVKGLCQNKSRFRCQSGKNQSGRSWFSFDLVDKDESSILVRSDREDCYDKIVNDQYYLLTSVNSNIYRSSGIEKLKIQIDDLNKIQHIKVSLRNINFYFFELI